ncbi:MAG: GNAT family N-acetyltransferase [Rhodobacteraceae bacterium]|nr:GNAT family N-acetyltransferase [Paracoccaceae bacterium]
MMLSPALVTEVMEATWPPAAHQACGPFTLRIGQGGGKRVSAATADGRWGAEDLSHAEAEMQASGQSPLFLIREDDADLDAALAQRGYRQVDPVVIYAAPIKTLMGDGPSYMTTFPHWPPMQIARQLWADGGIGPARLAVMERVNGPKCAVLGRTDDRAAGVAFVACHGRHAMLHALEVAPALRRRGSAQNILKAAAVWAQDAGADTLSLAVTTANTPAGKLYQGLGMVEAGRYHYRQK